MTSPIVRFGVWYLDGERRTAGEGRQAHAKRAGVHQLLRRWWWCGVAVWWHEEERAWAREGVYRAGRIQHHENSGSTPRVIVCRIQRGVSLRPLAALHALYSPVVFGGKKS